MTPIDSVLSRLESSRKTRGGWQARCPAHDDRASSLSIAVGNDDRVLLHCFGGCSAAQIASALGLTLKDLYAAIEPLSVASIAWRKAERPARDAVRAFIAEEVARACEQRLVASPNDTPHVRSRDVNIARKRANLAFGLALLPIRSYVWEGWHPLDTDPAWPMLFERALGEVAYELAVARNIAALPWDTHPIPISLHDRAAERARGWLREFNVITERRLAA